MNKEQKDDDIKRVAMQRRERMSFKNCGDAGVKGVFLAVESSSKFGLDIIPVGFILEGMIDVVPNNDNGIRGYIV